VATSWNVNTCWPNQFWPNQPCGTVVVTIPNAPTSLAPACTNESVSLTWTASTPDGTHSAASSYNVYRATVSGGPYTQIATGVVSTSYTDTGLTDGTTYYYVVTGVNSAGESTDSNETSGTPVAIPSNFAAYVSPLSPQNIITFTWDAAPGASTYTLERSTTSGGPYTIITSGIVGTTTTDTPPSGANFYYILIACNSCGCSGFSTELEASLTFARLTQAVMEEVVAPATIDVRATQAVIEPVIDPGTAITRLTQGVMELTSDPRLPGLQTFVQCTQAVIEIVFKPGWVYAEWVD
jgi:Fibronectin type III domain